MLVTFIFIVFFIYLIIKYAIRYKKDECPLGKEDRVIGSAVTEYINVVGIITAICLLFVGGWFISILIILWLIFIVNGNKNKN